MTGVSATMTGVSYPLPQAQVAGLDRSMGPAGLRATQLGGQQFWVPHDAMRDCTPLPSGNWRPGTHRYSPTTMLIAQGGGPSAAINRTTEALIRTGQKYGLRVLGAENSLEGLASLPRRIRDLTNETDSTLASIGEKPGAELGTTRDRLPEGGLNTVLDTLAQYKVRHFFYIGGNGSAKTVRDLNQLARERGMDLSCIHVPKTVDNDLAGNHHTPGFASAGTYVARATAGINNDNRSLRGFMAVVVMGRDTGHLTAATAMGRVHPDDGPHVICLPEHEFELPKFLDAVQRAYDEHGRCLVAVSEGLQSGGVPITKQLTQLECPDGQPQLSGSTELAAYLTDAVTRELGLPRVRGDTYGYVQRSYPELAPVDRREAYEVGEAAVEYALDGLEAGSIAICGLQGADGEYVPGYHVIAPEEAAQGARPLPADFIAPSGLDVTQAALDYMRPLLGPMPGAARFEGPYVQPPSTLS
jgi:6-phosphofructokinase